MSSRFGKLARFALVTTGVLGAALAGRSLAAQQANVCVDTSSPTVAVDRRVARAAFAAVGYATAFVSYDGSAGIAEKYFRYLARSRCALVMGFPVDPVAPDAPGGLALTAPYYATGYVLASFGHAVTLADLSHHATVAVGTATAPDFYLVGAFGSVPPYRPDVYQSEEEAIAAVVARTDDAAMVWGPSVERYRAVHPAAKRLVSTSLPIAHGRWHLAALYAPPSHATASAFERGLATLRTSGELARLTASSTEIRN